MTRLYIAVSGDLSPGLAAAQAVHAAFQFATRRPDLTAEWLRTSQFLIVVQVPDEISLIRLVSEANARDIPVETWHEPDLGDLTTAVAFAPGAAATALCGSLPLLGREVALI